jgi:hypothetical protein
LKRARTITRRSYGTRPRELLVRAGSPLRRSIPRANSSCEFHVRNSELNRGSDNPRVLEGGGSFFYALSWILECFRCKQLMSKLMSQYESQSQWIGPQTLKERKEGRYCSVISGVESLASSSGSLCEKPEATVAHSLPSWRECSDIAAVDD